MLRGNASICMLHLKHLNALKPQNCRNFISHADAVRKCEHLYAPTQTLLAENLSKSSSAKQTGTFCWLCATFLFFNILLGMGMYFVLRPIAYVLGGIQQLCRPNFAQFTTYPTSNGQLWPIVDILHNSSVPIVHVTKSGLSNDLPLLL